MFTFEYQVPTDRNYLHVKGGYDESKMPSVLKVILELVQRIKTFYVIAKYPQLLAELIMVDLEQVVQMLRPEGRRGRGSEKVGQVHRRPRVLHQLQVEQDQLVRGAVLVLGVHDVVHVQVVVV